MAVVRTFLLLSILFPQAVSKNFLSKVVDDDCGEAANEGGVPTGIPAKCKCRPFSKGCPKFRLWIDNVEIPLTEMHKTKKGAWKEASKLLSTPEGLAKVSSALAKVEENGDAAETAKEEDNQAPVVKNNEDDDEEWVWTRKGVSAIKKEGLQKQMGTPAAGDDVSVGAKNFMNKHGTAGSAIEHGMIKTAHQTKKAVELFSAKDEDPEGENIKNPFLTADQDEDSDAAVGEPGSSDTADVADGAEVADDTDLADGDSNVETAAIGNQM